MFLQVVCLRQQRIFLWSGFIVSLIAQFIVFASVDVDWFIHGKSDDRKGEVTQVLMFLPAIFCGLMVDIQVIFSTYKYKPVAFSKLVHPWARTVYLIIGFVSLASTLISFTFCIVVFGGFNTSLRVVVFVAFIVKAVCWSPIIGLEYYDTVLE